MGLFDLFRKKDHDESDDDLDDDFEDYEDEEDEDDEEEEYHYLYDNEYADEDEGYGDEVGCAACGNPAYPHCKASCPMFDD